MPPSSFVRLPARGRSRFQRTASLLEHAVHHRERDPRHRYRRQCAGDGHGIAGPKLLRFGPLVELHDDLEEDGFHRLLVDAGAYVSPVLTDDSLNFIGALTFLPALSTWAPHVLGFK